MASSRPLHVLSPCASNRTPAFCKCLFPRNTLTYKGHIPDLIRCHCGEEETHQMQWTWLENETDIIVGRDCVFHPRFSVGTSVVRGNKPLTVGMIHFWEIRILTPLNGTDVMFGIGTDKFDLNAFQDKFESALGTCCDAWGFSYQGRIQHNGIMSSYGKRVSQGCILGIYLDLSVGYLEFFLNRESMGIAFNDIPLDPHIIYYPMVCSTAAKSSIRLLNSTAQADSLQFRAFKSLAKIPKKLEEVKNMPGFRLMVENFWFLAQPKFVKSKKVKRVLSKSFNDMSTQSYEDDDDDRNNFDDSLEDLMTFF